MSESVPMKTHYCTGCKERQDEIDQLKFELVATRDELESFKVHHKSTHDAFGETHAELAKAKEEVEMLREKLDRANGGRD